MVDYGAAAQADIHPARARPSTAHNTSKWRKASSTETACLRLLLEFCLQDQDANDRHQLTPSRDDRIRKGSIGDTTQKWRTKKEKMMKRKKKEKRQKSIRSIKNDDTHTLSRWTENGWYPPKIESKTSHKTWNETWKETTSPLYLHDLLCIFYTIS